MGEKREDTLGTPPYGSSKDELVKEAYGENPKQTYETTENDEVGSLEDKDAMIYES